MGCGASDQPSSPDHNTVLEDTEAKSIYRQLLKQAQLDETTEHQLADQLEQTTEEDALFHQQLSSAVSQIVNKAHLNPGGKDKVLMIGQVVAHEEVITPPFGPDNAVAIKVKVMTEDQGGGKDEAAQVYQKGTNGDKSQFIFNGFTAVDFRIKDASGNEALLQMSKSKNWLLRMCETHVAWNIARDTFVGGLVSGGTGSKQFHHQESKPNAEAFWREFCDGDDHLETIIDMSDPEWGHGVRKAIEYSIRPGDVIAVLGPPTIDGKAISFDQGVCAIISNVPTIARHLPGYLMIPLPPGRPAEVPMRRMPDFADAKVRCDPGPRCSIREEMRKHENVICVTEETQSTPQGDESAPSIVKCAVVADVPLDKGWGSPKKGRRLNDKDIPVEEVDDFGQQVFVKPPKVAAPKLFAPEEVSAIVLAKMKDMSEKDTVGRNRPVFK